MKQMAVWSLLLAKIWTLVSWQKSKELVRPEKLEFDEALQEAFYKVRTGEIDELEVEGLLRERFECKRQN